MGGPVAQSCMGIMENHMEKNMGKDMELTMSTSMGYMVGCQKWWSLFWVPALVAYLMFRAPKKRLEFRQPTISSATMGLISKECSKVIPDDRGIYIYI